MTAPLHDRLAKALADTDETGMYLLFYDLAAERDVRVASVSSEADVADVVEVADARKRIADELWRRRNLSARIAAIKNAPPVELPPDTRPKPRPRAKLTGAWATGVHSLRALLP